ncbi:MAG: pentapeptide repeat-containing protein [Saprospiraceae bacterium]|nr:pentapeptide repeat-containing protein [Saprospiraceae bacterium]
MSQRNFLFLGSIGLVLIIAIIGLTWQNQLLINQLKKQDAVSDGRRPLQSNHNEVRMLRMQAVLEQLKEAVKHQGNTSDYASLVREMASINQSLELVPNEEGRLLSIERGLLLLALSQMQMDTALFGSIKRSISFAKADLSGMNLQGIDFSNIDLEEAELQEVNLAGANLTNANLRGATMKRVQADEGNFAKANCREADMSWAELNSTKWPEADVRGVIFENAKLRKADFKTANLQWANFVGAQLKNADFSGVDLYGGDMSRANLTSASLDSAYLKSVSLNGTFLKDATMNGVELIYAGITDENWFDYIRDWQVSGVDSIELKYEIMPFEYVKYNFRLMPKE